MKLLLPIIPLIAIAALPQSVQAGQKSTLKTTRGLQHKGTSPRVQGTPEPYRKTADPLEKVNRATFAVNNLLYRGILMPLAKGTEKVLPKPVLKSLQNFSQNLESPIRIVNRLLRAQPVEAGRELTKLVVNSTIGVGGILKPSESFPALRNIRPADTGQTLGKAGIPTGPYLVLPILGPSNCRDLVGKAGDWALNPAVYVSASSAPNAVALAIIAPKAIEENRQRMNSYRDTVEMAPDPYVAVREAYIDNRAAAVDGE
jgi:phospholipid-binding lipoprotein MlaA